MVHTKKIIDDVCACQYEARVVSCLYGESKDRLPAWTDATMDKSNLSV